MHYALFLNFQEIVNFGINFGGKGGGAGSYPLFTVNIDGPGMHNGTLSMLVKIQ